MFIICCVIGLVVELLWWLFFISIVMVMVGFFIGVKVMIRVWLSSCLVNFFLL